MYESRLRRKLVKCLKHVSPERLEFVCPECLEARVLYDHDRKERVCQSCGLVVENVLSFSPNLSWDLTYALTNNLAFGKSLGGTLPNYHMHKVLAKTKDQLVDRTDLPIRSRQIRIISESVDLPVVKNMINYGSKMLKSLDMNRKWVNYIDSDHVFADRIGRLLRKLGAFLQISKLKVQPYLITRAAVYYLLSTLKPEKAEEARKKYPFKDKYLTIVKKLDLLEKSV